VKVKLNLMGEKRRRSFGIKEALLESLFQEHCESP
jgi:hypothetical protein